MTVTASKRMGTMAQSSLRVNMEMVAQEAGISRATVSRVLSGDTEIVKESTRDRVLEAAHRLGYVRNAAATQLAMKTSTTVGLLLRETMNPAYGYLHDCLLDNLHARQLFVTTMSAGRRHFGDGEAGHLRRLLSLRPGGIFVCSGLIDSADIVPVASQMPTIVLPRPESAEGLCNFAYDEQVHGEMIAKAVVEAGHRQVAVVTTEVSESSTEALRARAIAHTLSELGVQIIPIEGKALINDADALGQRVIEGIRQRQFTALMFPNDRRALRFMIFAQKHGISIPEDLAVTGLDGLGQATQVSGLTTVRVPLEQVCERAVEHMCQAIRHPDQQMEIVQERFIGDLIRGRTI